MATRKEIQTTLKAQNVQRDSKIASFRNRLQRFMATNLDEILGDLESGDLNALEAANILGGLRQALVDAGLDEEVGGLLDIYRDELNGIEELFNLTTGRDLTYSDIDADVIDALINFDIERTRGEVLQYAEEIKSVIMRSVITGNAPNIRDLHEELGDSTFNNIETELRTSVTGFSQSLNNAKATEAGLELFLYVGPDDDATREFCADVLESRTPPIYTAEEIADMDNGQGLEVATYMGGYNCRHRWSALSLDVAKSLGYGEN